MTNNSIIEILREGALMLNHQFDPNALRFVSINTRTYSANEFDEFKRDMIDAGAKIKMLFLEQQVSEAAFNDFVNERKTVILVFEKKGNELFPIIFHDHKKLRAVKSFRDDENTSYPVESVQPSSLLRDEQGDVITFVLFAYRSLVSEYAYEGDSVPKPMKPVQRFFSMLGTERREIFYILFYSVIIGFTSLILPVGIQNTVELVSGGVFFSSIFVLIGAVILGVLLTGVLQIMQISLVEYLLRRIFTKASFEFAFRIPRIKTEALRGSYAPELINRFFDVITLQKGLPKLLIDLMSAAIQILFGLILLSLYHPFFVFFGLLLLFILVLIFWFTGPNGLKSSINESKYKYKVVHWLEELARAINSFKVAGNTDLPMKRTDDTVNNYLKYRKAHFKVLITQFSFIIIFKTAVTASLLIMGTILVVGREITLGQFVASEVVIILILAAVEKLITYMDVVYDLFTAVDKIAQVTDLPLEKVGGIYFPKKIQGPYSLEIKSLSYKYPESATPTLKNVNLTVEPGEHICIAGPGNSGKTTLVNVIAGLTSNYDGVITINNYSLRDLDFRHLRDKIAKNISAEEIFDGTILENITLGNPERTVEDALQAIRNVGLADEINALPEGLSTHIVSAGKGFSSSFINKLILARCLAKKPSLIILNDFFSNLKKKEKLELLQFVMAKENHWTLIAVSNDPLIMSACDNVYIMNHGTIVEGGRFDDLLKKGTINNYID